MNKKLKALFKGIETQKTCTEAYMITKYGSAYSPEKLFKEFLNKCSIIIKGKINIGSYCAVIDIEKDMIPYKDKVVSYFRDELKYKVACIGSDILNKVSGGTEGFDPDIEYIFISWKSPKLASINEEKIEDLLDSSLGTPTSENSEDSEETNL